MDKYKGIDWRDGELFFTIDGEDVDLELTPVQLEAVLDAIGFKRTGKQHIELADDELIMKKRLLTCEAMEYYRVNHE